MERLREPFQGVVNILRFNRHYYILSMLLSAFLYIVGLEFTAYSELLKWAGISLLGVNISSLMCSHYIYDLSNLYRLSWLTTMPSDRVVVNITAGFNEINEVLNYKFPDSELVTLDFYDPLKHTEISIKRAREAYPSHRETKKVNTCSFPLRTHTADKVLVMLSAHEIRDHAERINFFKEINRVMKFDAELIVIEHLRDTANFLAFNLGCMHFYSRNTWINSFKPSKLFITKEVKITPFITAFTLKKHGGSF